MTKRRFFDPDPPECLSQVWGVALGEAFARRAVRAEAEGRKEDAEEDRFWSYVYTGFGRLVR